MRIFGSALVATILFFTNAVSATEASAPQGSPAVVQSSTGGLAPGKPAGVQKAQGADETIWWILGAGIVIGGIVLVATGNNNNSTPASATTLTQ